MWEAFPIVNVTHVDPLNPTPITWQECHHVKDPTKLVMERGMLPKTNMVEGKFFLVTFDNINLPLTMEVISN